MRSTMFGLVGAVIIVTSGACAGISGGRSGDDSRPGGDAGIAHPDGADQLVLRVEVGGGFVPAEARLLQIPGFSLFGDGRVVITGAQIEIYPGPALPNLQVRSVTEEGVQAILEAARAAGLEGPDRHHDNPTVIDAPSTTFTVIADGYRHVTTVDALHEGDPAHQELRAFDEKLGNLEPWLPKGSVTAEEPFRFAGLRVFVMPEFPEGGEELPQEEKAWPVSTPLSSFGTPVKGQPDVRCGVVEGSDLEALRPLAQDANQLTPWRSGDEVYHLVFRPLLPDESGC
ncbi:MAG: hypothetical protein ABR518_04175 [Actinomycetota bacterium]